MITKRVTKKYDIKLSDTYTVTTIELSDLLRDIFDMFQLEQKTISMAYFKIPGFLYSDLQFHHVSNGPDEEMIQEIISYIINISKYTELGRYVVTVDISGNKIVILNGSLNEDFYLDESRSTVLISEKKAETILRDTITWLKEFKPKDKKPVIKSNYMVPNEDIYMSSLKEDVSIMKVRNQR